MHPENKKVLKSKLLIIWHKRILYALDIHYFHLIIILRQFFVIEKNIKKKFVLVVDLTKLNNLVKLKNYYNYLNNVLI